MIERAVVRLGREIINELERPAKSDEKSAGMETREETVIVASSSSKAAAISCEGYTRNNSKINCFVSRKDRSCGFKDVERTCDESLISGIGAELKVIAHDDGQQDMFALG